MDAKRVVHVGQFGEYPGGMAQVVNVYLSWSTDALQVSGWRTTRRKQDPLSFLFSASAMLRIALGRRRKVTLLIFHLSQGGSFLREGALLRFASRRGWRCVAQIHGSGFVKYSERRESLVRSVLRSATLVYVLSDETFLRVSQILPSSHGLKRISNVVNLPTPGPKSNKVVFGGAVGIRKGADVLAEAWERVAASLPGWELEVAGPLEDGFVLPSIERMAYRGPILHDAMQELLSSARVAVLPSRAETLPMFLLEAMAHSATPISTGVGQVADLIHGVGSLVEPGSVDDLADQLIQVCTDPRIDQRGARARARILERYSSDSQRSALISEWRRELES